jgi:HSP20 family protein
MLESTTHVHYFTPAADFLEDSRRVVIILDMPGAAADDVEIDIEEGALYVSGAPSVQAPAGRVLMDEYPMGAYYRSFHITENIDQTRVSANIKDGVLEIILPKKKKSIAKRINIE